MDPTNSESQSQTCWFFECQALFENLPGIWSLQLYIFWIRVPLLGRSESLKQRDLEDEKLESEIERWTCGMGMVEWE